MMGDALPQDMPYAPIKHVLMRTITAAFSGNPLPAPPQQLQRLLILLQQQLLLPLLLKIAGTIDCCSMLHTRQARNGKHAKVADPSSPVDRSRLSCLLACRASLSELCAFSGPLGCFPVALF